MTRPETRTSSPGEDPASQIEVLRRRAIRERACVPPDGDTKLVFGHGNARARLMLVGEAPGEEEERQGQPFVGRAGQLLNRAIAAAGIDRADVWVTNVVKFRPVRHSGARLANRTPTRAEVQRCLPLLHEEIAIIQPRAIVCLGTIAANALIGGDLRLRTTRGQWHAGPYGIPTLATYHPAYVLRLAGADRAEVERILTEDLRQAAMRASDRTTPAPP